MSLHLLFKKISQIYLAKEAKNHREGTLFYLDNKEILIKPLSKIAVKYIYVKQNKDKYYEKNYFDFDGIRIYPDNLCSTRSWS